ncbi:hypothetical protein RRG08_000113 [Elysia crispata]|uniref:Uncharacterized protein n=1 Tax=Elysia crispata TaxID=231223 RepID=A0AAE0Y874_9GAST|nr:hypothetical protein RRG08_000113 [Elysia crispata]
MCAWNPYLLDDREGELAAPNNAAKPQSTETVGSMELPTLTRTEYVSISRASCLLPMTVHRHGAAHTDKD